MLCRLFYFIYSGSYDVINDALAILVFIYTVCASEFDPGTSTVSTETSTLTESGRYTVVAAVNLQRHVGLQP